MFSYFPISNQVVEHVLLVHPIFVEKVYLDIFKMNLQVECASLPFVNANVLGYSPSERTWEPVPECGKCSSSY